MFEWERAEKTKRAPAANGGSLALRQGSQEGTSSRFIYPVVHFNGIIYLFIFSFSNMGSPEGLCEKDTT